MPPDSVEHRLAAILSADVVGYTRLMAEAETATVETLTAYREQISALVKRYGGRVVDAPGDNLLAEFPSAIDACRCALETQRVLEARNAGLDDSRRMRFRMGVHLGEVRVEADRIYGAGINTAARIEALAEAGGICISAAVYEQIRNQLEVGVEELGSQQLKNVPEPVRVLRLLPSSGSQVAGPRTDRRRIGAALALGAAVILAVLAWRALAPDGGGPEPPRAANGGLALAVLPLDNLSADPDQAYFTDGMTERLIAELGRMTGVRVISRTSVMQFKGTRVPLREIARQLQVDFIVEGSVLRADDRVRITAQLIDARSDAHLWSESYDRELRDVIGLQTDVARAIVRQVKGEVLPVATVARDPRPVNPAAYEAYLKGLYFGWRHNAASALKSVRYLQESIRIDPDYALPYAAIADHYSCTPTHAWSVPDSRLWPSVPQELMAKAREHAERALELDDQLPPAHVAIGLVRMFGDWDFEAAEAAFLRAIELDPSSSWAHQAYGVYLGFMGRLSEAQASMERAYRLDPLSVMAMVFLGEIHAWRGDSSAAIALWEKARELDPTYPELHQTIAGILCARDASGEAIGILQAKLSISPEDPILKADLGYCQAVAGRPEQARRILGELELRSRETYVSPMHRAQIHVGLGETEQAFAALEEAFDDRSFFLLYLSVDPQFDPLRSDPRFSDLLRRIGLPVSQRVETSTAA